MVYRKKFIKLLLIGNSGVGKTSLMNRYVRDIFQQAYNATIGCDFLTKTITHNETELYIQIYDTAGNERFRSLGTTFYRDTDGCILVFDLFNKKSFEDLEFWYDEFFLNTNILCPSNFPIIVFGNKSDISGNISQVRESDINFFCAKKNIKYYPISVKDNSETINKGIYDLIENILSTTIFETINIEEKLLDIKQPTKYCLCNIL